MNAFNTVLFITEWDLWHSCADRKGGYGAYPSPAKGDSGRKSQELGQRQQGKGIGDVVYGALLNGTPIIGQSCAVRASVESCRWMLHSWHVVISCIHQCVQSLVEIISFEGFKQKFVFDLLKRNSVQAVWWNFHYIPMCGFWNIIKLLHLLH